MLQLHVKIQNHLLNPFLKPIQIDRGIVKIRKVLNKLTHTNVKFKNVTLGERTAETVHVIYTLDANKKIIPSKTITETKISKLGGMITTRIEKYENKQRILVFSTIDDVYLKPIKKYIHN